MSSDPRTPASWHTYTKRLSAVEGPEEDASIVYLHTENLRFECSRWWAAELCCALADMIEVADEVHPGLAEWLKHIRKYTTLKESVYK